jgi:hypothetical protein
MLFPQAFLKRGDWATEFHADQIFSTTPNNMPYGRVGDQTDLVGPHRYVGAWGNWLAHFDAHAGCRHVQTSTEDEFLRATRFLPGQANGSSGFQAVVSTQTLRGVHTELIGEGKGNSSWRECKLSYNSESPETGFSGLSSLRVARRDLEGRATGWARSPDV